MPRREQLDRIERLLERLDAAVVVREPGNARSAEAFEGLRKQIIQSGKNHRSHVAHLLSLEDSLERGADVSLVRDRVGDFLRELGIERTTDVRMADWFEIVEGAGPVLECIEPAVIERLDGNHVALVRLGKARALPAPAISADRSDSPASSEIEFVESKTEEEPVNVQFLLKLRRRKQRSATKSSPTPSEGHETMKEEDDGSNRD